jgi:SAM-dependent methyltransferase
MKIDWRLTLHYGLTIFLSSFLLFQVQPMIGKMILPWFGGSASVWTTCMLFFQMVLLLGYFYSHWVVRHLTPFRQSILHGSLLLLSLLLLPIVPSETWKPTGAENPTLHILGLLTVSIGLPYFVLSTTGPLLQAWFARERSGLVPYRLFALSNLGSMLALLAYPLAIEPVFPTRIQSYLWSGLFTSFVLACGMLAWRGRSGKALAAEQQLTGVAPHWRNKVLWAALAACPSILMVADTSFLTENIAPIPMIWVAPLALYLLSFILSFESQGWYQRKIFLPLLVIGLGALAYLPTLGLSEIPIYLSMAINLSALFVACMVCHGELARLQPHPSFLTGYYLMLSIGGALGGFFVGVIAPYWFNSNYELSIGIVLTGLVAAIAIIPYATFPRLVWRNVAIASTLIFLLALSWIRIDNHLEENRDAEVMLRNFYGSLKVFADKEDGFRTMMHGQIIHGRQYITPDKVTHPTTYYSADGGAGKTLQIKAHAGPIRVGVIGLGVGTLASYGRKGDYFRLYDIDPLVIDIAHNNFSYLSRTAARTEIILGDARLQLEREPAQQFDVLVVDAFSGDSVPIHLLTAEAFALYFKHLKPDGVLAVHITNRFLDLRPVVKMAADHYAKQVRLVDYEGDHNRLAFRSRWALVSSDPSFFKHPQLIEATPISVEGDFKLWRDDYSSIFSILL